MHFILAAHSLNFRSVSPRYVNNLSLLRSDVLAMVWTLWPIDRQSTTVSCTDKQLNKSIYSCRHCTKYLNYLYSPLQETILDLLPCCHDQRRVWRADWAVRGPQRWTGQFYLVGTCRSSTRSYHCYDHHLDHRTERSRRRPRSRRSAGLQSSPLSRTESLTNRTYIVMVIIKRCYSA